MGQKVNVIGVGMTKFQKPGASDEYNVMAAKAARAALEDAKISFDAVEQAHVGYVYGDSTCGQRAVYELDAAALHTKHPRENLLSWRCSNHVGRTSVPTGTTRHPRGSGSSRRRRGMGTLEPPCAERGREPE